MNIKDRIACYSWNGSAYEVVIGLYSVVVVATFRTLRETRAYVEAHNASLT